MGSRMPVVEADVVVVGARVAGSVLAAVLGDLGHQVLVLDRARFPSPTLSTHFFRGGGLGKVLSDLGLIDQVLALGCPRLVREYTYEASAAFEIGPPQDPGELGYCLSVRREPLDALLVERARHTPGVVLREQVRASHLEGTDSVLNGLVVTDQDGVASTVSARLVVGADGYGSRVARWVDAPLQRTEPGVRALLYTYVLGFLNPEGTRDGPEFSRVGDQLAYAFPSDAGTTCLAVSLNLSDFARVREDRSVEFRATLGRHPGLAGRASDAEPIDGVLGCGPRTNRIRKPWGAGWALVGDAGFYQDPWTGEGMDHAAVHAVFLAESIDDWLRGRVPQQAALRRFHERRDAHALAGFEDNISGGRDLAAAW